MDKESLLNCIRSLFDDDGTPRERAYYGEAVALLEEFGFYRDPINPEAPKWIVFTSGRGRKAVLHWDADRNAWQIEPLHPEADVSKW